MSKFNQKINVREYQPSDRSEILDIYQSASEKTHAFLGMKNLVKEQKIMEESFSDPNNKCVVIERYGKVVGFTSFVSEIAMSAIFIKPNLQRKGLGKILLQYIQLEKEKIKLAVYVENKIAIEFYEKNGFEISESKTNENGHKYVEMIWEK
jgi:ribosomal protein S18 acetylase RimI-like enzyme